MLEISQKWKYDCLGACHLQVLKHFAQDTDIILSFHRWESQGACKSTTATSNQAKNTSSLNSIPKLHLWEPADDQKYNFDGASIDFCDLYILTLLAELTSDLCSLPLARDLIHIPRHTVTYFSIFFLFLGQFFELIWDESLPCGKITCQITATSSKCVLLSFLIHEKKTLLNINLKNNCGYCFLTKHQILL